MMMPEDAKNASQFHTTKRSDPSFVQEPQAPCLRSFAALSAPQ